MGEPSEADPNEVMLVRKLLETCHLNTVERRELPNGRVRGSVILEIIRESLRANGWFPGGRRTGELWDGIVIELVSDGVYRMHERYEIGVCRFSDVIATDTHSLHHAAQRFVQRTGGQSDSIDGIPIDWPSFFRP